MTVNAHSSESRQGGAEEATILVVDDHSVVRHGLSLLLAKQPGLSVCGEAATYEEALAQLAALKPDLAVLDITLRDRNGLDLIRASQFASPSTKFIVLSMHDEADFAERAFKAGALGYVMKEEADEVIVEAIRKVLGGELFASPAMAARVLRDRFRPEDTGQPETGLASLTERELDIFRCLGEGLTTRKIAEQFSLSTRTVEVHRANIKRKLQCEDAAQLLREAVRWVEGQRGV